MGTVKLLPIGRRPLMMVAQLAGTVHIKLEMTRQVILIPADRL